MTKQEAVTAMNNGVIITHSSFTDEEWMTIEDGKIKTEEGYKHSPMEFWSHRQGPNWEDGYSEWKESPIVAESSK